MQALSAAPKRPREGVSLQDGTYLVVEEAKPRQVGRLAGWLSLVYGHVGVGRFWVSKAERGLWITWGTYWLVLAFGSVEVVFWI